MVAQWVFGLALGYEDLIDQDHLRHDPVFATLAGKLEAKRQNCAQLAGKSTLNRLEHAPLVPSRYHKLGHDPAQNPPPPARPRRHTRSPPIRLDGQAAKLA
jgi:hypothetical protein